MLSLGAQYDVPNSRIYHRLTGADYRRILSGMDTTFEILAEGDGWAYLAYDGGVEYVEDDDQGDPGHRVAPVD